jgi:hypothetical protein
MTAQRVEHADRAERIVRLVVDGLLDVRAFDPYWLDLPLAQYELSSRDFPRDGVVPREVLQLVQDALGAIGSEGGKE